MFRLKARCRAAYVWWLAALCAVVLTQDPGASEQVVKVGQTVNMECTKPEGANVVWDRASRPQSSLAVGGTLVDSSGRYTLTVTEATQTLIINAVAIEDEDVYRCYTLFGTDYDEHAVTVVASPELIELYSPTDGMNEGEEETLTAVSYGSKPTPQFSWTLIYFDGTVESLNSTEEMSRNLNGTFHSLSQVVLQFNSSMYRAQIRLVASMDDTDFEQEIQEQLRVNLRPLTPRITSGFAAPYRSGADVTLECTVARAVPAPVVSWAWAGSVGLRGADTVTQAPDGTYTVRSRLRLTARPQYDGDGFECLATNIVLEDAGLGALGSGVYYLTVLYAPIITLGDQSKETPLFEGGDVTFTCSIEANPKPQSSGWIREGLQIEAGGRISIEEDISEPNLSVTDVTIEEKGLYACWATNELGTTQSDTINLEVFHSPYCSSTQLYKYAAREGETIQLQCRVEANPAATVYFGWKESLNAQYEVAGGIVDTRVVDIAYSLKNYTVRSASDYRTVFCQATNGIGSTASPCELSVLPPGPAQAPGSCSPRTRNATALLLRCYETFAGGSQATYVLQILMEDGGGYRDVANITGSSFSAAASFSSFSSFSSSSSSSFSSSKTSSSSSSSSSKTSSSSLSSSSSSSSSFSSSSASLYDDLAVVGLNELDFPVTGLVPAETYTLRVCASNAEFWQSVVCGENFQVTMDDGPLDAPTPLPILQGTASASTIAGGTILVFIIIGIIAGLIIMLVCEQKNKKKKIAAKASATETPVQMVEVIGSGAVADMSFAIIDDDNDTMTPTAAAAGFASIDDILQGEGVEIKQPGSPHDQRNSAIKTGASEHELNNDDEADYPVDGGLSVSEIHDTGSHPDSEQEGVENQGFDDVELGNASAHSISSIDINPQPKSAKDDEIKESSLCKQS